MILIKNKVKNTKIKQKIEYKIEWLSKLNENTFKNFQKLYRTYKKIIKHFRSKIQSENAKIGLKIE